MASRLPVIRQSHLLITLLQCGLLIVAVYFADRYLGKNAALSVLFFYVAYGFVARRAFTGNHRRGMGLFHEKKFREAAEEFALSYEALRRSPWIDQWRGLVLLSPSNISFREMALVNGGFCHAKLGERDNARALYEQALREFPGSAIAETGLRFLH